jgi:hypothetical protein
LLVRISVLTVGKPVSDVLDGLRNVARFDISRSGVVSSSLASLINEREVDEVVVGLPSSSMVLNIIGEGGALNEGVHVFTVDKIRVEFLEGFEFGNGSSKNGRVILGK